MESEILSLLQSLGFSPMESEVYLTLHRHPDITAYGVAQQLQKNRANIYKSLETLQRKQAAIASNESSVKWRAVPYTELLNRLESEHNSRTRDLRNLLSQVTAAHNRPSIFHFDQLDMVFYRVSEMIGNAKELILLDAFPQEMERYRQELTSAAQRGVHVALRTYGDSKPLPAVQHFPAEDPTLTKTWNSVWLNLVVDGKEFLLSNMAADHSAVHHAYWSDDAYMSIVYGSALIAEMTVGAFIHEGGTSNGPDLAKTFTDLNRRLRNTSKYQALTTV